LPTTLAANTIEPLLLMAEQGVGIACLPDFLIHSQLEQGTLVTVLDAFVAHAGTLRVLWPSSRHLAPKLRAFVDFVSGELLTAAAQSAPKP
jgi:DNA-binding transcriptional LysR family regulator